MIPETQNIRKQHRNDKKKIWVNIIDNFSLFEFLKKYSNKFKFKNKIFKIFRASNKKTTRIHWIAQGTIFNIL